MAASIQEPVWDTQYSEELNVPVPDLYPELSESLQNMQESDTEQVEIAKGVINVLLFNYLFLYFLLCADISYFLGSCGKGERKEIKDICDNYRQFRAYNLFRLKKIE